MHWASLNVRIRSKQATTLQLRRPMRRILSTCCARAATDQVNRTAEKRDKLAPPHCCPRWHAERSRSVSTRTGSLEGVPECSMSALGQKQTYAPQKAMSALPLRADISRSHN